MNKEVTIDIENPKDNDLISRQAVLKQLRGCLTEGMTELFEYILIALACPLILPMIEEQESEDKE